MNQKETIFTQKAKNYFVCFADQCPLHATCLRWEVGQYVDVEEKAILSMNPRNHNIAQGECEYYRKDELIKMPIGMREHFYYDMPRHTEQAIKQELIDHFWKKGE